MPDSPATTPVCDIDFYSDTTLSDPLAAYAEMLQLGTVVWLEKNNLFAICGYGAVVEVLRNHQKFSSGKGVSIDEDVNKLLVGSTLNSDPPQHDITRRITFAPVSPRNVGQLKQRIEDEANSFVKKLLAKNSFDAATEFAPHLPLAVVRDLVGLGDYGKDHMLDWGAATFELMGDPKERRADAVEKLKRLRSFLEDTETLSHLSVNGWAKRGTELGIETGMEPSRAAELMRDYIAPSLDTTISAISYGIKLFAENPGQWRKLRDNRALMRNAIEEIVRLNTPIRAFTRYVTEDIEIDGTLLQKDSRVLVVYGSANRDPSRFPNPNEFNIERKTAGHVGFGHGLHTCLGMNLARLEINSLFSALANRVQRFEITGPITQGINSTINSLASLPVRLVVD